MSNIEQRPDSPSPEPNTQQAPVKLEPWSVWWSRLVQVSGLAIMAHQTFAEQADRQWLLLCAMGMMLGEIGLKSFVRFMLRNAGGGNQ